MMLVNRISFQVVLPAALAAALFSFPAFAQSQDEQSPSVADAARRAREQKKKSDKPARVINDDNLKPASPASAAAPATGPSPEAVPPTSSEMAPQSQGASAPTVPPTEAAPAEKKESSDNSAEAAGMKAQLEELQKELDLLQREVPLARDTYYSKPDYAHDTAGKAKLDALLQQVTDKQQDVDALKMRLAALLEQLAKEQPASAENPEKPATPPQL
jgi:uncharacterized coiled-coil protein SlyX